MSSKERLMQVLVAPSHVSPQSHTSTPLHAVPAWLPQNARKLSSQ